MQVAAIERTATGLLVKLYAVKEQPEPGLFSNPDHPSACFSIDANPTRAANFPIGKEFDLLFAAPIHQLATQGSGEEKPKGDHAVVQGAVEDARLESLHEAGCDLRTGAGSACTCSRPPVVGPELNVTRAGDVEIG